MYDEDWHLERAGDTYAMISREYYKTPDFAAALEAYNKERRRSGERIIRVPPIWVLEEQFPHLIGTRNERTSPPSRSGESPKFEPVETNVGTGSSRQAPPPAVVSRQPDEYRVTAEAGETIREIARKVYGSAEAWRKLFDLNPNIDPTVPIPAGTILRLAK